MDGHAPSLTTAAWLQSLGQFYSPYDVNPTDYNPLKEALAETVDFEHLQRCKVTSRLFICATNVRSGKIKVFGNAEVTIEAVLASACLPNLSRRWRSTARPTGTAATWGTPPSSR